MQLTLKQVFARSGLFVLLLFLPLKSAFALVMASSTLSIFNLQIIPITGSVVFSGPPDVSASVNASFNSLGETDSNGAFGTGIDVLANAAVTFAAGHAEASASAGTASVTSAINLGGNSNAAGVSSPGSVASLSGFFDLTGVSGMVDVAFSFDVSGLLHGFADSIGSFGTDFDASLEIDGTPMLFDFRSLSGGPNFPDTTQLFSETLSATVSLDSTQSHFYIWTAHSDTFVSNTVPEPGTIALVLVALGLLQRCRRTRGGRLRKRSLPRHCA